MKYDSFCSYRDVEGEVQDCEGNAIEEVRDIPYTFPIDFVTYERWIERSFTMGKLYFMFDNFG